MTREPAAEQSNNDLVHHKDTDPIQGMTTEYLFDQLRHHAVRLLSELSPSPRALRLRAGDVSLDLEWDSADPRGTASSQTATARKVPSGNGAGPAGQSSTSPDAARSTADTVQVTAPSIGVFYLAPEPGAAPFVRVGDTVTAGQQVAIVEVMKLFIPVTVEVSSRVVDVLKTDGDTVEYGEPVLLVSPTGRTGDV